MKTTIQKTEFSRALGVAQGIVDRKSTMPILANVVLRAQGGDELVVEATDLNVFLRARLASANKKAGAICLLAKELHDVVASAAGADISLEVSEKHWMQIRSGKSKGKLAGTPDTYFPSIPDPSEAEFVAVDPAILQELIDKSIHSTCDDTTRMHLNGIFIESDGNVVTAAATDGHRLARVIRKGAFPALKEGVIVPRKGAAELRRMLSMGGDECRVAVAHPHIYVDCGVFMMAIKLIASEFPPYQQIIPDNCATSTTVDRQALLEAVRRIQVIARGDMVMRLAIDGERVEVSMQNPEVGEIQDEVAGEGSGNPMHVGINPRYVVAFLASTEAERVDIELSDELDPVIFRNHDDESYLSVIMPMRSQ